MPNRKSAATPLQRGSACLCCRKRKLKCDGTRPVCTQCIKMNRDEECEYDDKKQKSRTQKLKEKLSVLEQRLRELESGSAATSPSSSDPGSLPVTQHSSPELAALPSPFAGGSGNLFDNYSWSSSSASSSLCGGPSGYGTPELDASRLWDSDDSDPNSHPFLEMSPFSSLPSSSEFPYMPRWNPQEPLPFEIKKILLDIFLAHRHQCWFDGQVERFSLSNTEPFGFEPHPALMNAIYLLACHFARSPYCSEIEPIFFTRALHEITVALDNADRLVDIVQASCLLSVYLYVNCRSLEGYTHSFSAARLAVGLGLHQIRPLPPLGTDPSQLYSDEITPIPIPPARDRAEMADRIAAFWQVFMVDRCWSVASGLPVALPDGDCPQVRIKTPWPTPEENDVHLLGEPSTNTVSTLFELQPMLSLGPDAIFMPALRAKAAALYERTYRLAFSAKKSETYWADHHSAGLALQRFALNLPAFVGYEAWRTQAPLIDVDLFTVHTMVHVSTLHLYKDNLSPETFHGANSILALIQQLIRQLNDVDYEYLDPVLSACWSTVARTYVRMMAFAGQQIDTTTTVYSMPIIEQELGVILNAMKTLSAFFPTAGEQAMKINQEAAQARTNAIL
ncbi:hypothetical protein C8R45DRAFT_1071233 [Mycena sanguinolenta]|nr:hypothetical protein C8R45DRAFT_1071233 [Mycena sanguinolenta]